MGSVTLVYSNPFQGGDRPYLALEVTGINGQSGSVIGLLDSGADMTQLPIGFASLMGYDQATLQPISIGTAGAPAQALRATKPCRAIIPGLPAAPVDLLPVYSPSPFALWGRTDFFAKFGVMIEEKHQRFTLHW
jgi:hypothetical protein